MNVTVDAEYGYVILVAVLNVFMLQWMGFEVVKARKKYEVMYPKMYSDTCNIFNCIQRAHQNTATEVFPTFLFLLLTGGLIFPRVSAVAGVIFCIGKVMYAKGYATGDPKKRMRGSISYVGLLTVLVNTVLFALRLLGVF